MFEQTTTNVMNAINHNDQISVHDVICVSCELSMDFLGWLMVAMQRYMASVATFSDSVQTINEL